MFTLESNDNQLPVVMAKVLSIILLQLFWLENKFFILTCLHFLVLGGCFLVDTARHSGSVTLSMHSWPVTMYGGNSKSMLNISIPCKFEIDRMICYLYHDILHW